MAKLKPISITSKAGELEDIYFDVSIIIDKDNKAVLIDNSQEDWRDFVDCNTLKVEKIKISI